MTLGRLGAALAALPAEELRQLPQRERELIAKYAEAEAAASNELLHSVMQQRLSAVGWVWVAEIMQRWEEAKAVGGGTDGG